MLPLHLTLIIFSSLFLCGYSYIPDFVCGDMDSARKEVLTFYESKVCTYVYIAGLVLNLSFIMIMTSYNYTKCYVISREQLARHIIHYLTHACVMISLS